MLKMIDNFLDKTTMYKVVLYYLFFLWLLALVFSFFGFLPYTPVSMIISLVILLAISAATNYAFSYVFKVPANTESIYISVFILALIITPALVANEYIFLGWAGILAMSSKYIFTFQHKHFFNPVAFAVFLTSIFLNQNASWWIGTLAMAPFVLAGGLLIVRKIKRKDLTLSFFITALLTILFFTISHGGNILSTLYKAILYSPLLFFTFIMITEPLTTPPSKFLQILYGVLVGFLFAPEFHTFPFSLGFLSIGAIYSTPEIALLVGNVFSFLVSPKKRLTLKLKKAVQLTPDTAEFIFESDYKMNFKPGQYLEFTLGHNKVDNRGNRRYFTIASSPTEKELYLGVKFYPNGSTFKKAMAYMNDGDSMIASQLSGDFVLPRNKKKKLVFIAGGIGITPFRSMIKYLIDKKEKRDIILIYSNKKEVDIVYRNIFEEAKEVLNMKTIYTLSDKENVKNSWKGRVGSVNGAMILDEVEDYNERTFYISGPPSMVSGIEKTIMTLGLPKKQIITDFFPGFA